jgi:uncharacterized glyoxalase superfamily protein PhnB
MRVKKITPLLYVDEIEPVLAFWTAKLGFAVTTEIPEGDALGFVMLARDDVEVMYQTRASVESDLPSVAETPMGGTILFVEVDDLDAIETALEGVERVVPRRTTFYGSQEVWVREPAGNLFGFAHFAEGG